MTKTSHGGRLSEVTYLGRSERCVAPREAVGRKRRRALEAKRRRGAKRERQTVKDARSAARRVLFFDGWSASVLAEVCGLDVAKIEEEIRGAIR